MVAPRQFQGVLSEGSSRIGVGCIFNPESSTAKMLTRRTFNHCSSQPSAINEEGVIV